MAALALHQPALPNKEPMATVLQEIDAAAAKSYATEKHTPMMQQYFLTTPATGLRAAYR
jgi:hypothetical protein